MARRAACRAFVAQLFLAAPEHAFERNFEPDFDVLAARRAARAPAKKRVEQSSAEVEIEAAEDVVKIDPGKQVLRRKVRDAGEAVRIVLGALLRIGEHRVGRGDLLETLLGAGLLVAVGMILQRELA